MQDQKPLISVIVPVYNTKAYLDRCLNSIIGQTYQNLEIILVDDGSTDGSGELCDLYSQRDLRIKVIHKTNGGQGSARNVALDVAKGQYVAFVDSDDWIDFDMYNNLLDNARKYDADISCCANSDVKAISNSKTIYMNPNIMREYLGGCIGLNQSPCNKMFKRHLFNQVRFLELRAYEDCATLHLVLAQATKAVYQDTVYYYYEKRQNSTMTQSFSSVKFQAIIAYQQVYDFYKENYVEYASIVKEKLVGALQYCIGETIVLRKKKELKKEYENAIEIARRIPLKQLNCKQKILLCLIKYLRVFYGILYKFFKGKHYEKYIAKTEKVDE